MKEIKRCPFCGGEARLQRRAKKHGYYVVCKSCGCRTPYFQYQFDSNEKLREEATKVWNTRKPMERILERLETGQEECYKLFAIGFNAEDRAGYDAYSDAIEIVKEEGEVK